MCCRVKQYEGKLATLSVFNDALQKENTQLRDALEDSNVPRSATDQEVLELKQEFTRRMAAADKDISRLKAAISSKLIADKFANAAWPCMTCCCSLQEKNEQLRNKLNAVNQGGSSTQARLRDRENYITSLQVRITRIYYGHKKA